MKIERLPLTELKLIHLDRHSDDRGFFMERFNEDSFSKLGITLKTKQLNHAYSKPNVLRGLHYQHTPPQGKLIGVLVGKIFDVAVDLRKDSPTFGKHFSVILSEEVPVLFWIPAGFAHGYCVMDEKPSHVLYATDEIYNAKGENGIHPLDPTLGIQWPVSRPVLSEKDKVLPLFSSVKGI